MTEAGDLRQRRQALQTELAALRERQERASRANSYAMSRQRAGVTDHDELHMQELADDEVSHEPAITDVRRQIESIDTELSRDRAGVLAGTGRRVMNWLRK
jgi:predicted  nucleic acid-binding Zn-ribbon protein